MQLEEYLKEQIKECTNLIEIHCDSDVILAVKLEGMVEAYNDILDKIKEF